MLLLGWRWKGEGKGKVRSGKLSQEFVCLTGGGTLRPKMMMSNRHE